MSAPFSRRRHCIWEAKRSHRSCPQYENYGKTCQVNPIQSSGTKCRMLIKVNVVYVYIHVYNNLNELKKQCHISWQVSKLLVNKDNFPLLAVLVRSTLRQILRSTHITVVLRSNMIKSKYIWFLFHEIWPNRQGKHYILFEHFKIKK